MGSLFQSSSFVGRVLDRAVATTFPGWAERRAKDRASLNFMASIGNIISTGRTGTSKIGAVGKEGTLRNWNPNRVNVAAEAKQREDSMGRAHDMKANDPHGNGLLNP